MVVDTLLDKALQAFQLNRNRQALLRLLYLECEANFTVLDPVVKEMENRGEPPSDSELSALSECVSTDVLGGIFVMGAAQDVTLQKLTSLSLSKSEEDVPLSNALARLFIRANAVPRLARIRGGGMAQRVNFKVRLANLRNDFREVAKVLRPLAWE
jgi:hypothetical protein